MCGKRGHLQIRCPATAPRHVLLPKGDIPRHMRAALAAAEQRKAAAQAAAAAAAATAAAAAPAPAATVTAPRRPTDPAPMRPTAPAMAGQRRIVEYIGTAPKAPWAPPAAPPAAAQAPAQSPAAPQAADHAPAQPPAAPQTSEILGQLMKTMAGMEARLAAQQKQALAQMEDQVKRLSTRLAELEPSAAGAATPMKKAAKKHKTDAATKAAADGMDIRTALARDPASRADVQEPSAAPAVAAVHSAGQKRSLDDEDCQTQQAAEQSVATF
jgi:uncharacterized coiled-coil protein SlyX